MFTDKTTTFWLTAMHTNSLTTQLQKLSGRNSYSLCISYSLFTLLMLCLLYTQIHRSSTACAHIPSQPRVSVFASHTSRRTLSKLLDPRSVSYRTSTRLHGDRTTQKLQKTLKIYLQKIKDRFCCLAEFKLQSKWGKKKKNFCFFQWETWCTEELRIQTKKEELSC